MNNHSNKQNAEQEFARRRLQDELFDREKLDLSFEMNIDEFVREWYDSYHTETSSIRAYIERIITDVVDIETQVPNFILNYAGTGIDSIRDLLMNLDKLEKIEQLTKTERHVKEKLAKILLDAVTKDISNINHVLSALTIAGVIHGTAAGIITPVGSFAIAALAWGAVGFSSVSLYRASRDYASPTYQLEDKLTRYQKVDKKIEHLDASIKKLKTKMNKYDGDNAEDKIKISVLQEKIARREQNIERWIQRQEVLKQKAIGIIQFNRYNARWHKENPISPDLISQFSSSVKDSQESIIKEKYQNIMTTSQAFNDELNEEISDVNRNVMMQLKKNQRDLVISRTISTMSLAIMAVGATLIAVSPFTAHAAPIVMAVGFALIALGGAVQMGQKFSVRLVNMIAKKHRYKQAQSDLIDDMNMHSSLQLSDIMDDNERLKYYLSFKLNKDNLKQSAMEQVKQARLATMPTDADLEAAWYKKMGSLDKNTREQVFNTARKKMINETILRQALSLKVDQPIPQQLSDKAKTKIINRASRNALRHSISEGAKDIFQNAKEKIIIQTNRGVMKIQRFGMF